MSQFKFTFITNDGSSLARIAKSADKKIVFTRAISSSHWDSERGDLGVKDRRWFNGPVGSISKVSVAGNVSVKAVFSADELDFPVKSIGLCAQLKKEGESPSYDAADDIIFAILSDDNSCFVSTYDFSVVFDLSTQALGMVDAVGGDSPDDPATLGDLLDLGASIELDSDTHSIQLKNSDSEVLASVDANDIFDPSDYYSKDDIDGNFLASATYDSNTHTLTLTSADGTKVISLDLT